MAASLSFSSHTAGETTDIVVCDLHKPATSQHPHFGQGHSRGHKQTNVLSSWASY